MQSVSEILVVEDNLPDFILLQEYLSMTIPSVKNIRHVPSLRDLSANSDAYNPQLIFLDLNLSDSNGLETFVSVNNLFSFVPIIILSGHDHTDTALQAIQAGAQDYILKGDFDDKMLNKTIQYSIERKRNQIRIQESNQLYEMVSKATNDPLWDWDLATNEIKWNDKVNIFGYPEELPKNDDWFIANVHPEDLERVNDKIIKSFKDGFEQWSDNYRFRCFDSSYKYILDRGYIIRDKNGKAIRMFGAMQDITEQVLLQRKLDEERSLQQKALLTASIDGQEKERSEIGKELHDNINQMLASIKLMVSMAMTQPTNTHFLSESVRLADECIQEIRKLSSSLVPIKEQELELVEAIKLMVSKLKATSSLAFHLFLSKELTARMNDRQQLSLYRIVQEQVNNIIKHADASLVTIVLEEKDGQALLRIIDDGKGFSVDVKNGGIGLKNIKSRTELLGGTFFLESEPGNGCTMEIRIPFANKPSKPIRLLY